jgi:hypothetical protein
MGSTPVTDSQPTLANRAGSLYSGHKYAGRGRVLTNPTIATADEQRTRTHTALVVLSGGTASVRLGLFWR